MRTWRDVARYHLVGPWVILLMPWAILACSFIVNLVIFPRAAGHHRPDSQAWSGARAHNYTGGVASIYVMLLRHRCEHRRPVAAVRAGSRA